MKLHTSFALLFFISTVSAGQDQPVPCPFDKDICQCIPYGSTGVVFSQVRCSSATLPTLQGPSGVEYVTDLLDIVSDGVDKLPANYFASFTFIQALSLSRLTTGGQPVSFPQHFDDQAFSNINITRIEFKGIDGLVPPPKALLSIVGLGYYTVQQCHDSLTLGPSAFNGFALKYLKISACPIASISATAFSGLAATLNFLSLANVGLVSYPQQQIQNLVGLLVLDLSGNQMIILPANAFQSYAGLTTLSLSGNPLESSILSGSLDNLPATVTALYLANVGFAYMPTRLLQQTKVTLTYLDLSQNQITAIKSADVPNPSNLIVKSLELSHNPITSIESGSLKPLSTVNSLTLVGTNLADLDLAAFSGMGLKSPSLQVGLDSNKMLKSVTFSSTTGFPNVPVSISMTETSVQMIDSTVKSFFQFNAKNTLDISGNRKIFCQDIDWIAPFVFCSNQVQTSRTTFCVDKAKPLDDYLSSIGDNSCTTSHAAGPITVSASTIIAAIAFGKMWAW